MKSSDHMDWVDSFPALHDIEAKLRLRLAEEAHHIHLPANSILFVPQNKPDSMLLILQGQVRVQQVSEQGREIVLYRILAGQSCILTTACLFANEHYTATAISETAIKAVAIPRVVVDQMVSASEIFRRFVFTSFSYRLTEMFKVIEDVAFARLDIRLAQRLLFFGDRAGYVRKTHFQLAAELGTAREVISRQLKDFEDRGLVELRRGGIQILSIAEITRISHREK